MDDHDDLSLVPLPRSIHRGRGRFHLGHDTMIACDSASEPVARLLAESLRRVSGFALPIHSAETRDGSVIDLRLAGDGPPEGYELETTDRAVAIRASSEAGLFYGCQSFRQLLPPDAFAAQSVAGVEFSAPAVRIVDAPRFSWRGLMLDSCRHFLPIDAVLVLIDRMAELKFNRLHWHLTEDQGWRVQIHRYPRLTEVGAWRHDGQGGLYGGYYRQDELRRVVDYAARRQVTIVPEIEMPGHSVAAVASYPHLGCRGEAVPVRTEWGISEDIYCAGSEKTFEFLEGVLDEVLAIFPGLWIHIGGDEAPKTNWRSCPKCRARMAEENIQSVEALQIWFTNRIHRFLADRGRTVIGWDEILQPGLDRRAIVQNWRPDWIVEGKDPLTRGTQAGYRMIASPVTHCYLDYSHMVTPVDKVAAFEPIGDGVAAEQVLGIEGTLWSERIPDQARLEEQAFPRAAALAEVAWTARERRDRTDLLDRLAVQQRRLEAAGTICFREPALQWDEPPEPDRATTWRWELSASALGPAGMDVALEMARGRHPLRVHAVRLLSDGRPIAESDREVLVNWRTPIGPTYRLTASSGVETERLELEMTATAEGGVQTRGYVRVTPVAADA